MALQLSNVDDTLTANPTNIIAAAAAGSLTILKCTVANTDVAAHQVTVYRVPNGGAPSAGNELVSLQTVAAGETLVLPLSGHNLVNGQTLQGKADVAGLVNLSVSYALST